MVSSATTRNTQALPLIQRFRTGRYLLGKDFEGQLKIAYHQNQSSNIHITTALNRFKHAYGEGMQTVKLERETDFCFGKGLLGGIRDFFIETNQIAQLAPCLKYRSSKNSPIEMV